MYASGTGLSGMQHHTSQLAASREAARHERLFLHEIDDDGGINSGQVRLPRIHSCMCLHRAAQGYSHQVHAIACAMVEAKRLKRTLVLPNKLLLERKHSFTAGGDGFKMMEHVLNFTLLQSYVPIIFASSPNDYADDLVGLEMRTMLVAPVNLATEVGCGVDPQQPPRTHALSAGARHV